MPAAPRQAPFHSVIFVTFNEAFPKCRSTRTPQRLAFMTKPILLFFYALVMIIVIVGVDLLFFKDRFWARLMANIGIVLVFAAFYLRCLK
jgi:Mg2+/Co2+ transporter CorB